MTSGRRCYILFVFLIEDMDINQVFDSYCTACCRKEKGQLSELTGEPGHAVFMK